MIAISLGVDVGTRRFGFAQGYGTLAQPWMVLAADQVTPQKIVQLAQEIQATAIVVGVSENESAAFAQRWYEMVKNVVGSQAISVQLADETLSTHLAWQHARERRQKLTRETIDAYAAAEMLQQWLDET